MKKRLFRSLRPLPAALLAATAACARPASASAVRVVKTQSGYRLMRDGRPFFIKGAGGDASKLLLRDCGGNSFRTWGVDHLGALLDEAQRLGLTVTAGIWLGHKEQGFDYHNAGQVAAQLENARRAILRYRNHPALLMWGIGNEMEGYGAGDDPAVWNAVEAIAAAAKQLDPDHPRMTVIAEIGGRKVPSINKYCPDIDVVGINTYGGAPSIPQRYKAAGGVKPYVITEYGPPGVWETGKTSWGAAKELSSTEKAMSYRKTYRQAIAGQPLCLGSYAFAWGSKQEATATWYGMLLPDGARLAAVDAVQELWSGTPPPSRVPEVHALKLIGPDKVRPGATVQATLDASDPGKGPLAVRWVLQSDPAAYHLNGGVEAAPATFPEAIVRADATSATVRMPESGGAYRLFAYVHNARKGAAVVNVPLFASR